MLTHNYSQAVSHQRWIWGSYKLESIQGIHPGLETQGRRHQKSKTGVSVKPKADITRNPKQGYQWNPRQTSPEVQNRGISSPTKRTCVLEKFMKKSTWLLMLIFNLVYNVSVLYPFMVSWLSISPALQARSDPLQTFYKKVHHPPGAYHLPPEDFTPLISLKCRQVCITWD